LFFQVIIAMKLPWQWAAVFAASALWTAPVVVGARDFAAELLPTEFNGQTVPPMVEVTPDTANEINTGNW